MTSFVYTPTLSSKVLSLVELRSTCKTQELSSPTKKYEKNFLLAETRQLFFLSRTSVARWYIFKPKMPIWVNFECLAMKG
jgi:hypothetical protein